MIPADERKFLDAGIFIGAILLGDPRHSEAYPLVAARHGDFRSCTSVGVLSEVYAALTWTGTVTPHTPADAARSVRELVEQPSAIEVLQDGFEVSLLHLRLAEQHHLTARRIHDARHAATALHNNAHTSIPTIPRIGTISWLTVLLSRDRPPHWHHTRRPSVPRTFNSPRQGTPG